MGSNKRTASTGPKHPLGKYLHESTRPLTCLVFVLPLILIYEVGTLALGRSAIRNGADVIMRQLLDLLGLGQYFLLPLLTTGLLLAWHHTTREKWRVSPPVLLGMLVESALFGWLLVVIARFQGAMFAGLFSLEAGALVGDVPAVLLATGVRDLAVHIVAFCGAGVYEELLFRLMLLSGVAAVLRAAGAKTTVTFVSAVLFTSLVFSAAHYKPFTPYGDVLQLSSFVFRTIAGIFFAILFVTRGFGVAAGSHALYDIFVSL